MLNVGGLFLAAVLNTETIIVWNLFVSLVNCHRYQAVWYRVFRTSPSALQSYRLSISNDYYKRTLKVCLLLVMRSTSVWWLFWTLKWAKETLALMLTTSVFSPRARPYQVSGSVGSLILLPNVVPFSSAHLVSESPAIFRISAIARPVGGSYDCRWYYPLYG